MYWCVHDGVFVQGVGLYMFRRGRWRHAAVAQFQREFDREADAAVRYSN